jgi:hypothetical protein
MKSEAQGDSGTVPGKKKFQESQSTDNKVLLAGCPPTTKLIDKSKVS